jgi:hypothetical protein
MGARTYFCGTAYYSRHVAGAAACGMLNGFMLGAVIGLLCALIFWRTRPPLTKGQARTYFPLKMFGLVFATATFFAVCNGLRLQIQYPDAGGASIPRIPGELVPE